MKRNGLSAQLRNWQEEARRAREADAPARALRLAPEVVTYWTRQIEKARPLVKSGRRPCDYEPWTTALNRARGGDDPESHYAYGRDFCAFMADVALPAWPEPRRDLIEFALAFLEADVMIFRSGYAKRHMIKRLQQAPLTPADIARIEALLHRAVLEGTGLEEYRAWCRMAGYLVDTGRLPDLPGWLPKQADGTILTLDRADGRLWHRIANEAPLCAEDRARVMRVGWRAGSEWGVPWPDLDRAVRARGVVDSPEQRARRNAWRMLDHIARRTGADFGR